MKKLVIALAIMATAAIAQEATYKHPGWMCRDLAILNQQLELAVENHQKASLWAMIDFVQNGEPSNFNEACTKISNAILAQWPECEAALILDNQKHYGRFVPEYREELALYAVANPSPYDLYLVIMGYDFAPEWGYDRVAECLVSNTGLNPEHVLRGLAYLNKTSLLLNKPDQEVHDLFKRLNRAFSARLIDNKERWGGVVAQIRTIMETYK